jgi:hypothetical protein
MFTRHFFTQNIESVFFLSTQSGILHSDVWLIIGACRSLFLLSFYSLLSRLIEENFFLTLQLKTCRKSDLYSNFVILLGWIFQQRCFQCVLPICLIWLSSRKSSTGWPEMKNQILNKQITFNLNFVWLSKLKT